MISASPPSVPSVPSALVKQGSAVPTPVAKIGTYTASWSPSERSSSSSDDRSVNSRCRRQPHHRRVVARDNAPRRSLSRDQCSAFHTLTGSRRCWRAVGERHVDRDRIRSGAARGPATTSRVASRSGWPPERRSCAVLGILSLRACWIAWSRSRERSRPRSTQKLICWSAGAGSAVDLLHVGADISIVHRHRRALS
jgi:hypothetical protein